ncbi:MAG TPA: heat-inducible transcriptional repressor HrcA [Acidimicrobiia bacterium]|jgi:heat-inducible transcriptional repressor
MELDDRKATILRAIVEEHITTAQPVGSQTIARSRNLGVSSATVRNDMTVLEREGYLVQPHTSAGRVPTDRGYRFFVDNFDRQPGLAPAQRRVVSDFFTLFQSAHQVMEELFHETSQLLARVSTHTAVVVGPHVDTTTVRSVQLVTLQPSLLLALAILSNGRVEKAVLHVGADTDDATVATASALLDTQLSGVRWERIPEMRPGAGPAADTLACEARDALAARAEQDIVEPLYVGGASRLAADHEAFPATDSAARLLELLERQVEVVSLVHDLLEQGDTTVRIGSENSIDELRNCSIVVAPYKVDGEVAGTVGVLGPTRMDYRQALAAVEAISQQLGDVLS